MISYDNIEGYDSGSRYILDVVYEMGNFLNQNLDDDIEIFTSGGLTVDYYWDKFPRDFDVVLKKIDGKSKQNSFSDVINFMRNSDDIEVSKVDYLEEHGDFLVVCSYNVTFDVYYEHNFEHTVSDILPNSSFIKLYLTKNNDYPKIKGNEVSKKSLINGNAIPIYEINKHLSELIEFFGKSTIKGYNLSRKDRKKYLSKERITNRLERMPKSNVDDVYEQIKRTVFRIYKDKVNFESVEEFRDAYKDFFPCVFHIIYLIL